MLPFSLLGLLLLSLPASAAASCDQDGDACYSFGHSSLQQRSELPRTPVTATGGVVQRAHKYTISELTSKSSKKCKRAPKTFRTTPSTSSSCDTSTPTATALPTSNSTLSSLTISESTSTSTNTSESPFTTSSATSTTSTTSAAVTGTTTCYCAPATTPSGLPNLDTLELSSNGNFDQISYDVGGVTDSDVPLGTTCDAQDDCAEVLLYQPWMAGGAASFTNNSALAQTDPAYATINLDSSLNLGWIAEPLSGGGVSTAISLPLLESYTVLISGWYRLLDWTATGSFNIGGPTGFFFFCAARAYLQTSNSSIFAWNEVITPNNTQWTHFSTPVTITSPVTPTALNLTFACAQELIGTGNVVLAYDTVSVSIVEECACVPQ